MSVGLSSINLGSTQYQYDQDAIRSRLASRGLPASEVEQTLTEIAAGNFSRLSDLGIADLLTITSLPQPGSFSTTALSQALTKSEGFDILAVLRVLHEAGKELREAQREMRHAETDIAMGESLRAADKIRDSAMMNMIFGVVTGAVSVASGLVSAGISIKQGLNLTSSTSQAKVVQAEFTQTQADLKLSQAQVKLSTAKTELQTAKAELQTAQTTGKPAAEIEVLQQKVDAAQSKVDTLTNEIPGLAADASKANNALKDTLTQEVASKKAEVAKLEKTANEQPSDKATADLTTARRELTSLEGRLEAANQRTEIYSRDPTSTPALAEAPSRAAQAEELLDPLTGRIGSAQAAAQAEITRVQNDSQATTTTLQGVNASVGGLSQGLSGLGSYMASEQQAEGAEHTAKAEKAKGTAEEDADYQKSLNELVQSVQSLLKEVLQAQNQADATIYQHM
ncbi:MAG: hypothetical protein LBU79_02140 [Planctomycetota bacterium]|jgi:hypothetical protein|nr:hypothetical protein [Planctomycetota bacterium]